MWEIRGNIERISTIEALLRATGAAIYTNSGSNTPVWHQQNEFKSPVYYRKYKVTTDKRIRYLCQWFDVKFEYDLRQDKAAIQFKQDGKEKLQYLVKEGFNLLKQTMPEEAETIKDLKLPIVNTDIAETIDEEHIKATP